MTNSDTAQSLLVFRMEEEAFAIGVSAVHEILDPQMATPVPNADAFACAVINVRGTVVPVVDIRYRLEMGPTRNHDTARIIVIETKIDDTAQKLAFAADAVEDVAAADPGAVEMIPDLGAIWPQDYLLGAVRRNGELVVLLNTETLFNPIAATDAAA